MSTDRLFDRLFRAEAALVLVFLYLPIALVVVFSFTAGERTGELRGLSVRWYGEVLDNRFATLPSVVAEGRRVIANIERVARLFVTKNFWAAVLAVLTGVLTMSYPILPRQLSVIDAITIGIPGFVLSFQASHEPVRTGFIPRNEKDTFEMPPLTFARGKASFRRRVASMNATP